VDIAGITVHPDERWMQQIARNVTMEGCGALRNCRYLLHDRDTKYTQSFRAIIASGQVEPLALPARSPNLNAYSERWVRSVEGGMPVQGDTVRRALLSTRAELICRTFSCGAKSSGEGQRFAVPSGYGYSSRGAGSMPRATGWALALLPSRGRVKRRGASDEFFDLTGDRTVRPGREGEPCARTRQHPHREFSACCLHFY
jgi:hypothetical protein